MTEYFLDEFEQRVFDEREHVRKMERRAEAQSFVRDREKHHAPVTGALYRCLRRSQKLAVDDIVMVVSSEHHTEDWYQDERGKKIFLDMPEWRGLKIIADDRAWSIEIPVVTWYRWFERVK